MPKFKDMYPCPRSSDIGPTQNKYVDKVALPDLYYCGGHFPCYCCGSLTGYRMSSNSYYYVLCSTECANEVRGNVPVETPDLTAIDPQDDLDVALAEERLDDIKADVTETLSLSEVEKELEIQGIETL